MINLNVVRLLVVKLTFFFTEFNIYLLEKTVFGCVLIWTQFSAEFLFVALAESAFISIFSFREHFIDPNKIQDVSRCWTQFYSVLVKIHKLNWWTFGISPLICDEKFLPSFTWFYLVLLGFTGFYWVLLGFTGFSRGFT